MRRLLVALTIATFALTAGCSGDPEIAPSTTNAATAVPAAAPANAPAHGTPASSPPGPADIPSSALVVTGPIIVEHQLDLTAQRDGVVTKLLCDVSSRVKAGALMAQLDDRQITANLEAARAKTRGIDAEIRDIKAEAEVIQADYGRAQRRWDLGLISEEELQHAKYKAESEQWNIRQVVEHRATAQQDERSLELELEKTRITAPFSGLVARRYVREGQSVARGDRLFWLTAESPLLMRFTLPEKYFGRLHRGQKFEVTSADLPGEKHAASVREISPVIDPASGTFEVLVELAADHGSDHSPGHNNFRPGMNATLHLGTNPATSYGNTP
jgi:membrane fusion protein, multidrug efflux system